MNKTDLNIFSSEQWFSALDRCNREAIEVMLSSTSLVEHYVSQLVNYQLSHKKKNVSYKYYWRDNISNLITFCNNPTLEGFVGLCICRDYIFNMIKDFDKLTEDFRDILFTTIKFRSERFKYNPILETYYNKIGYRGDNDFLFVINHNAFLKKEYENIRNLLIMNYSDYVMSKARADYAYLNQYRQIPIEDIKQNYVLAVMRAINKYDVGKGSFKNYLDIWIRKYREDMAHFSDTSLSQKSIIPFDEIENYSNDNDQKKEDTIVEIVKRDQKEAILDLARLVDPNCYAVEYLELGRG